MAKRSVCRRPHCVLACLMACGGFPTLAQGALYSHTLNTSLSPVDPANGYQYFAFNSPLTVDQVFTTTGGVITSNTMGNGFQGQGSNYVYKEVLPAQFEPGNDWEVSARVRVLESESVSFLFGFFLGGWFDGIAAGVGLTHNAWQYYSLAGSGSRDNREWTDWRILTDRASNTYEVFVDNQLLFTDNLIAANGSPGFGLPVNHVLFGDGTGGSNARAEISSFAFRQVPTPGGTAAFMMLGALGTRRRR